MMKIKIMLLILVIIGIFLMTGCMAGKEIPKEEPELQTCLYSSFLIVLLFGMFMAFFEDTIRNFFNHLKTKFKKGK